MCYFKRSSGVFLGLWVVCSLILSACSGSHQVTDDDVAVLDEIGLKELIRDKRHVVLIDARPDYRYRLGHLPGAINIPLPELTSSDQRFDKAKHVVVYGEGLRNALSHAAAKKLLVGKHYAVSDFRGGFERWQAVDGPIVTGPNPHGGSQQP